jgi:hypothetical protein
MLIGEVGDDDEEDDDEEDDCELLIVSNMVLYIGVCVLGGLSLETVSCPTLVVGSVVGTIVSSSLGFDVIELNEPLT